MSRTPAPVLPGSTIGIVGGGQLGRMLALEARRMGYQTRVLDPGKFGPTAQVADEHLQAPLDDTDALRRLADGCGVVTFEWENAGAEAFASIADRVPLRPGAHVLHTTQHRIREKNAVRALGISTADYAPVDGLQALREALGRLGAPALLKTTFGGYDGLGQGRIHRVDQAEAVFEPLRAGGASEWILEAWVDFEWEVSVMCARSPAGEIASFPVVENIHREGILDVSIIPARIPPEVAREALRMAEAVIEGLDVVGILGVEMFVTGDGRVLVNELAPRPHNSGHYTWEACVTSQFEQQLRAVCALPLGATDLLRPASMANLLGRDLPEGWQQAIPKVLATEEVALHLYGKAESRPGRKMGHLTAFGDDADSALERVLGARTALSAPQ